MATGDESNYGSFRVIAWTLRIVGYLVIAAGIVGLTIAGMAAWDRGQNPELAVSAAIVAAGIIFVALGEASFALIDIALNTRPKP